MLIIGEYLIGSSLNLVSYLIISIVLIIIGIFQIRRHYIKIIYCGTITVLLAATWIDSLIQPIYAGPNLTATIFFNMILVMATLFSAKYGYDIINTHEKYQKIIKHYSKHLSMNPNDITALNNKGVELTNINMYEEAIECFDKILQLDPANSIALYNKSLLLKKMRKHLKSIEYRDKALKLDPKLKEVLKSGKLLLES